MNTTYEYAGFIFEVIRDVTGKMTDLVPAEGQHQAAYKDKHRRNARECYRQDHRE